jgi:GlpG protein
VRLIGHLSDEKNARTFADFLFVQGIHSQAEQEGDTGWAIWVQEEDHIERASGFLEGFKKNPADPQFRARAEDASQLRAEKEKDEEQYRKRLRGRRHLFRPLTPYSFGPLTFILIVISIVVFLLTNLGHDMARVMPLFITDYYNFVGNSKLPEIRHGEIWRLITPIFIHYDGLHILFNMLWLRDLGSMIEGRQNWWTLLLLTLIIAAGSNLAQFYFRNPNFGGMSGVVYGLLGYIWIRGKLDPGSGLYLHPSTVFMMIVWFFVCLTGFVGHVANHAHAAGLLMGMAWGYLSSLRYR